MSSWISQQARRPSGTAIFFLNLILLIPANEQVEFQSLLSIIENIKRTLTFADKMS
jgi:hypothetical protein